MTICPECGADLIKENSTVLLSAISDTDKGAFLTNLSGSHFCEKCPIVVFDKEKVSQAALLGIKGNKNLRYTISGILYLYSFGRSIDAVPEHKRHLEMGTEGNPLPLVQFLPDLNKTLITDKRQGRNDLCLCGSGKKYKKCCVK